ncbi:hypothetical protein IE53DRAFT_82479 [Violaceomyces palustris]|uniref:Uncharacterized protein n=1 Tax=Violaceomyces palustris TaxID=1673888 RepID=A0ACD0NY02_9BASI|nr:hypothetical protein IE53DRAFT_82479 [Violaceomyces palustris]
MLPPRPSMQWGGRGKKIKPPSTSSSPSPAPNPISLPPLLLSLSLSPHRSSRSELNNNPLCQPFPFPLILKDLFLHTLPLLLPLFSSILSPILTRIEPSLLPDANRSKRTDRSDSPAPNSSPEQSICTIANLWLTPVVDPTPTPLCKLIPIIIPLRLPPSSPAPILLIFDSFFPSIFHSIPSTLASGHHLTPCSSSDPPFIIRNAA